MLQAAPTMDQLREIYSLPFRATARSKLRKSDLINICPTCPLDEDKYSYNCPRQVYIYKPNNGHITILQYCYDVCYRVLRIFLHAKDLITHNMYWKHEVGEKISLAFHDIDLEK